MARKRPAARPGTLVVLEHTSRILKGNPLGDPHVRRVAVWLPPEYADETRRRFPVLFDVVGFTGSGLSHVAWKPFGDNVPERVARLIGEKKMGPVILVFPDCFTALGGNQYVRFLAAVWKKEKLSMGEGHCLMNLCMAATYDPDPKAPLGFRVPFNLESGEPLDSRKSLFLTSTTKPHMSVYLNPAPIPRISNLQSVEC